MNTKLTGRMAKCSYGCSIVPSHEGLPFFTFKGEGSEDAQRCCKNCPYHNVAHGKGHGDVCNNFEPKGAFEFDQFYCGCRGWD